ncbi:hypothetical protein OF364_01115 [Mycoplasma enhydrae]|uniref:hypothetical protein n=1 Tax=Mycoplasma enhydrae TaxID=2499220 RepID=UPI0021E84724|nr:hypothetical protein [Mycoplasma enhydrae]MCV3753416.1 hypothetical protein [Mycoplasma enhydrae]
MDKSYVNLYDSSKIKPAYKNIYNNYVPDKQSAISTYLDESDIIKRYLDLYGNEYKNEPEAKKSILDNYDRNTINNLFYEYKDKQNELHYFNPFVESDQQDFLNLLIKEGQFKQGYILKNNDGEDVLSFNAHKRKLLNSVIDKIIELHENKLLDINNKIPLYKIKIYFKKNYQYEGENIPDSRYWVNFIKYNTFSSEKPWIQNGNSIEKTVNLNWLKKYLLNEELFTNFNKFNDLFDKKVKYETFVMKTEYFGEKLSLKNGNNFLDFSNFSFESCNDFRYNTIFPSFWLNWYIPSGFFRKRSWIKTNFTFNISIEPNEKSFNDEIFTLSRKNFDKLFLKAIKEGDFEDDIFKGVLLNMSDSIYSLTYNYLQSNKQIKAPKSNIEIDFNDIKFTTKKRRESPISSNFSNFEKSLNYMTKSEDFIDMSLKPNPLESNNIIKPVQVVYYENNPIWYINSDDLNDKTKYINISNNLINNMYRDKNYIIINLKDNKDFYEEFIKMNKDNDSLTLDNFNNLHSTKEKILYAFKTWIKWSKDKAKGGQKDINFVFNKDNNNNETFLLKTLKENKFLNIDIKNIPLKLFKTFASHIDNNYNLNRPYIEEIVFNELEYKKFKEKLLKNGIVPRIKYKIQKLESALKANNIEINNKLLEFNDPEILLQNYNLLLGKLILPSKEKIYYVDEKNNSLLYDLNLFDLWEINLSGNKYYFENLTDLNKYIYKYIEIHKENIN